VHVHQAAGLDYKDAGQVAAAEDLVTQGVATPSVGQIAVHVHQAAGLDYKDAGQVAAAEDLVTQGVATPSVGQIAVHVHQAAGLDYKDAGQVAAADHLIRTLGQANPTQAQIEAADYLITTLGEMSPTKEQIAAADYMIQNNLGASAGQPTGDEIAAVDYMIQQNLFSQTPSADQIDHAVVAIAVGISSLTEDHVNAVDALKKLGELALSRGKIIAFAALARNPSVEQVNAAEYMAGQLNHMSPTANEITAAAAFIAGGVVNPSLTEIGYYNGISGGKRKAKRTAYVKKILTGGSRNVAP
jgi:hypothetical protein